MSIYNSPENVRRKRHAASGKVLILHPHLPLDAAQV
jgi:hypothetical protein